MLFKPIFTHPYTTNGPGVMIAGSGGIAEISSFSGPSGVADPLDVWAFILAKTEDTQNTTNVGSFPTFLRRGYSFRFWYRVKEFEATEARKIFRQKST
jgi:hypothetical protein